MTSIWPRIWSSPCARVYCVDLFLRLFPAIRLRRPTVSQQPLLSSAQDIMAPTAACLTNLPPELILDITDYLALDAILALKLTQRRLNNVLRLDKRRWKAPRSGCTQRACRKRLAPPSSIPTHRYCILCQVTCPIDSFKSSHSSACVPMARVSGSHDVVELPPNVCFYHVARFTRAIKTESGGKSRWISHRVKTCNHCGYIQGWDGTDPECGCECKTCTIGQATAYTQYLAKDVKRPEFVFWRETPRSRGEVGQLWVRETHRNANGRTSVINLPVRPV